MGSKYQVEIQNIIDEVKKNAQVELQSIKENMQEEMETKLKKKMEAIKIELLNNFKFAHSIAKLYFRRNDPRSRRRRRSCC